MPDSRSQSSEHFFIRETIAPLDKLNQLQDNSIRYR